MFVCCFDFKFIKKNFCFRLSFNELNGNKTITASHSSASTEANKKTVYENIRTAAHTKETSCFVNLNQNENENKNKKTSEDIVANAANYVLKFSDLQRKQLDEQLRNVNTFFLIIFFNIEIF